MSNTIKLSPLLSLKLFVVLLTLCSITNVHFTSSCSVVSVVVKKRVNNDSAIKYQSTLIIRWYMHDNKRFVQKK